MYDMIFFYLCSENNIKKEGINHMDTLEKLSYISTWTIEKYDDAGAHIKEHLISLSDIVEVLNNSEKKQLSVFLNEDIAEKSIHKALNNPLIQRRIERWCTHPDYQDQTRMIIGYPMEEVIGYFYELKEPSDCGYLAMSSVECKNLCIVILRKPNNKQDFILYSAYPKRNNLSTTL